MPPYTQTTMQDNTTMVKAEINDDTNQTIEAIQAEAGINKAEATAYLLGYGSAAYNASNDGGEVPWGEQPRDESGDPILNEEPNNE